MPPALNTQNGERPKHLATEAPGVPDGLLPEPAIDGPGKQEDIKEPNATREKDIYDNNVLQCQPSSHYRSPGRV